MGVIIVKLKKFSENDDKILESLVPNYKSSKPLLRPTIDDLKSIYHVEISDHVNAEEVAAEVRKDERVVYAHKPLPRYVFNEERF